jgi:hypothetical protein
LYSRKVFIAARTGRIERRETSQNIASDRLEIVANPLMKLLDVASLRERVRVRTPAQSADGHKPLLL